MAGPRSATSGRSAKTGRAAAAGRSASTRLRYVNVASLSSLVGWYRGDTGTVSSWTDKSGAGNHLLQATANLQPTINATASNGQPGFVFDGANDFMTASFTLAKPLTIFLAAKWTSAFAAQDSIVDGGPGNSNSARLFRSATATFNMFGGSSSLTMTKRTETNFHIYQMSFAATGLTSYFYQDNYLVGTASIGGAAAQGITVGSFGTGGTDFSACTILEIAVFSKLSPVSEGDQICLDWKSRYGL